VTDIITIPSSRRLTGGDTLLVDPPEVRQIFFVGGIQFTRADAKKKLALQLLDPAFDPVELTRFHRRTMFPEGFLDRIPQAFVVDDGVQVRALHFNAEQNVLYTIEVTEERGGYVQALLTPGAIVVYGGHARFGRGPCFAPTDDPGDNWENGTNQAADNRTGLFRMGFPFIGIPMHDLIAHQYRTTPLPTSEPRPAPQDSDPGLRRHLGELRPRTVAQMHPDPAVVALLGRLFSLDPAGTETFWTFFAVDRKEIGNEAHVVVAADFKDTSTSPNDLGSIEPLCRVFCHFACSTFLHNFTVLRTFKQWTRRGDDRFAFWTTDAAPNTAAIAFIVHLMTAPGVQAGKLWDPWLTRAVTLTNRELRAENDGFQLI
jgi:hypothetical protein